MQVLYLQCVDERQRTRVADIVAVQREAAQRAIRLERVGKARGAGVANLKRPMSDAESNGSTDTRVLRRYCPQYLLYFQTWCKNVLILDYDFVFRWMLETFAMEGGC